MGAGCIVVNYDGSKKHPTIIEEGALSVVTATLWLLTVGKGAFVEPVQLSAKRTS